MADIERISGVMASVEFVDEETRDEEDDREAGTYVTIFVKEDHPWGAGEVIIERPAHVLSARTSGEQK